MTRSESLVLFDIDGTLLRGAARHHKDSLIEGIRRVTAHQTTLDGISTSGMLDCDLIALMLRACGETETRIRKFLGRIVAECQACYAANCVPDLSPFVCPGVRETLRDLRSHNAVIGLVSGNLSSIGWKKIEQAGLREYFAVGAFAEDGRTRARLASIAASRAKTRALITKRARISLVGDHPNDIEAAKANGFIAVAVRTGLTPLSDLQSAEPDILVADLSELDIRKLVVMPS